MGSGREVQLSREDIDHISRVVATEVPERLARTNPQEYQRMVGAVVDTIANRYSTGRYGKTLPDVLNQRRAFSKITGPARLAPYGSVQKAPKAGQTVRSAVNYHLNARARGVPSQIPGALDYANPHFSDASNLRGWINGMIDAGAKRLGVGKSVHFHGVAPGNKPAADFNVGVPPGLRSSPIRDPSLAWQGGTSAPPAPTYAAPVGHVSRAPLGPASVPPDRPMPSGPIPGSIPSLPASAPVPMSAPSPQRPPDMMWQGQTAAPAAPPAAMPAQPSLPPSPPPASVQRPTVAPPEAFPPAPMNFPPAPAPPSRLGTLFGKPKGNMVQKGLPVAAALAGSALGGLPGGLIGMLAGRALANGVQGGMPGLGGLFDAPQIDRFGVGSGLGGIMSAMGGPRGATGFSRSNPGMSVTNMGQGFTEHRSNKYGWTERVAPDGSVVGITYDRPDRPDISPAARDAIGRGRGGLY